MNNKNKKFTLYLFSGIVLLFSFIVISNIILDPFSIFTKTDYESIKNKKILPNERFIKMKYILQNPNKYDSFLIGSCTSNYINLDKVPYGNWYNLTYTNAAIGDMNNSLKLLLSHKVNIKRILVQISEESLKDSDDKVEVTCQNFINFCSYPDTFSQKIPFYFRYLTYFPKIDNAKYDIWLETSKKNIFKGGSFIEYLPENKDEIIPLKVDSFNVDFKPEKREYNPKTIALLREMYDLCEKNNINFELFILPQYIEIYKAIDLDAFNEMKRQITEFTPFYDFTGINEIALDKNYYIDPVHINNWASKLIVDRIFYQDKQKQPKIKNYGNYVTKDNVASHIEKTKQEMSIYNDTH